jgi:hypothetical protein
VFFHTPALNLGGGDRWAIVDCLQKKKKSAAELALTELEHLLAAPQDAVIATRQGGLNA